MGLRVACASELRPAPDALRPVRAQPTRFDELYSMENTKTTVVGPLALTVPLFRIYY